MSTVTQVSQPEIAYSDSSVVDAVTYISLSDGSAWKITHSLDRETRETYTREEFSKGGDDYFDETEMEMPEEVRAAFLEVEEASLALLNAEEKQKAQKIVLVVRGNSDSTMEKALEEALDRIRAGNLSGSDRNEESGFYFAVTNDVAENEIPA